MRLVTSNRRAFGLSKSLYNALYLNDPNYDGYKLAGSPAESQPSSITPSIFNPVAPTYQSSKLANGITVLTESVTVPSTVSLGVFIDLGSRDENAENSGATLLLKNAHLKTALNTNETVNYGITQMSGGEFEVKYNQENIFYRANCLAHDVVDVFSMVVDCATEPRNNVACAVGRQKNEESHLIDDQNGGNLKFNDQIFSTAFGGKGLGNPTGGRRSNIANLSAEVIQKFQLANITNDRIVVSATGVENHQEFVELVSEKFSLTQLGSTKPQREASQYVGGEIRNFVDSNLAHVAFAFEGTTYQDAYTLLVASEVLGRNYILI
jgi:predicted Zn-dependent peptidase